MSDETRYNIMILLLVVIALLCGALIGDVLSKREFRQAAVKAGHAHYDSLTGAWQWNTNCFKIEK